MMRITPSASIGKIHKSNDKGRSLIQRLFDRFVNAENEYRELRKLERLDTERLRDIGVTRSELEKEFQKRFGRRPEDVQEQIMRTRFPF